MLHNILFIIFQIARTFLHNWYLGFLSAVSDSVIMCYHYVRSLMFNCNCLYNIIYVMTDFEMTQKLYTLINTVQSRTSSCFTPATMHVNQCSSGSDLN
jgi:hypothetical protein